MTWRGFCPEESPGKAFTVQNIQIKANPGVNILLFRAYLRVYVEWAKFFSTLNICRYLQPDDLSIKPF